MLLTFEKKNQQKLIHDALVTAELPIDNMSFKTCTFVFKISPKTPKMAGFLTEELPDNDNYQILINYKF